MAYLLPCLACNQIVSLPQDLALVRFFPQCNHLFHIACLPGQVPINQSTCPTCRGRNWRIGLTVGGAAIGALLAPVVAPPLLGIVGFSAAGPVAGTIAAAIQSSIGNVAAGSAFAVCQSVAMGGALPALGYAAGAAGGAAAAAKITDGGGNGGQGGLPGGGGGPGPNGGGGGPGHDGPGPHGGGGGGPPPYTRYDGESDDDDDASGGGGGGGGKPGYETGAKA